MASISVHSTVSSTQRTWPAILTLFFLSPLIGEVLSGSTPPLQLLSPFPWLTLPTFYGSGALLAREIVRRRGWGWENLFVLGMAYGILEEGIQVQTWFNFTPTSPSASYNHYGEFFHTNWLWALNLTTFHAVISITLAVMMTELLFPRIAARPWLGPKGRFGLSVMLGIVTISIGLMVAFVFSAKDGYTHPPLVPYLIAIILMLGLFFLGSRVPLHLPVITATRPAPRLWTVRLTLWALTVGNFLFVAIGAKLQVPSLVTILATMVYDAAAIWRVYSWSVRPGWNASHRLAVASGIIAFFFVFAPLIQLPAISPDLIATVTVEGLAAVFLSVFAGVIKRHAKAGSFATISGEQTVQQAPRSRP